MRSLADLGAYLRSAWRAHTHPALCAVSEASIRAVVRGCSLRVRSHPGMGQRAVPIAVANDDLGGGEHLHVWAGVDIGRERGLGLG